MFMVKNLLAVLGFVALAVVIGAYVKFGGMLSKVKALDEGAIPAYTKMFNTVLETGNPAEALVLKWEVNKDVETADVVESIKALAEEYNMRVTGDTKMFIIDDAKDGEIKSVRNISMCSLSIAKQFLAFSQRFGGFMPCRIMIIELGNGTRYLYTMDLALMIHGGKPLPKEMLALASHVQKAMTEIPARAAEGDF
jgi:uncharacterized protein (DUF302 family)